VATRIKRNRKPSEKVLASKSDKSSRTRSKSLVDESDDSDFYYDELSDE